MRLLKVFIAVLISYEVQARAAEQGLKQGLRFKREEIDDVATDICGITPKEENELKEKAKAHKLDRYTIEENDGLFQGDIMLTDKQKEILKKLQGNRRDEIISKEIISKKFAVRWPVGKEIYYMIDKNVLNKNIQGMIKDAVTHLTAFASCIKFYEIPLTEKPPEGTIKFYQDTKNPGCWADLGFKQLNRISIPADKEEKLNRGIIIHEILHAFGFVHEHCRNDRDQYITIIKDNIKEEHQHDYDFEKLGDTIITGETFGTKYDFNSIMHYATHEAAKDPEKPTIVLKPKWKEKCENSPDCIIAQRHGLSKSDAIQLNKLFKCPDKKYEGCDHLQDSWPVKDPKKCKGLGCVVQRTLS
eukprot:Seg567.9 transcript_id=Seg567.9/GoldUCD/mRNA.D3Y31 product="Meprin A subunit beta" protein_id=Seg567.9/GoldUCD/D3Y31